MSVLLGLLSLESPSQNILSMPVGEHATWDEYIQSYTNISSDLPEKSCFDVLPGGSGSAALQRMECEGGDGIITFLIWLYWQLTQVNTSDRTEPRDENLILVSHYTSEAIATEHLASGQIVTFANHVYVFVGRSNVGTAQNAGASFTEVRIVFDAYPTELILDPAQENRMGQFPPPAFIPTARQFRIPGPVDISWRRPCIERPIRDGILSLLGAWQLCPR